MANYTVTLAVHANANANDSFGPAASGRFDFTLLFEDIFLSLVPSILLLSLAIWRVANLNKQPLKVKNSPLYEGKLLFLSCYAILQLALMVLWSLSPELGSKASVLASSFSFLASICLIGLSHLEHLRSIRPSAIINVYLLFTLLFDVAKVRTLWQSEGTGKLAAIYSSSIGVKVLMVITESMEKRGILFESFRHPSPEATSGIYGISTFSWLYSLLQLGFRTTLQMNDLYPLGDDMQTNVLLQRSSHAWGKANHLANKSFLWSTIAALKWPISYLVFPRLCQIGFMYSQPFLIARTITFSQSTSEDDNIGWSLVGAFGLVLGGLAITTSVYQYYSIRFTTAVRGSLVTMIYVNTMGLSTGAFESTKALTLFSTDVEAICQASRDLVEIPASVIEAAIASWLIFDAAGVACISPVMAAALSVACISIVAKYMGRAEAAWIGHIETRVTATSTWLSNAKVVKMLGFTDVLENLLQKLRRNEISSSRLYRRIFTLRVLLSFLVQYLAPLFTFTILVLTGPASGREVNAAKVFSIVSILSLLATPISMMVQIFPTIATALKCFQRIQDFLNSECQKDHRLTLGSPATSPESGSSPSEANADLLVVLDASIGWSTTEPALLHNLNFTVKTGKTVFVIGPVGVGKSTLLKAMIGEAVLKQGFVYTGALHAAYVDQTPWIQNASVRDNVLGISIYDATWYDTVVKACALDYDISKMAKGDRTLVGSGGISLSGGQKQRLALARAVYSKHKLILIDDAFSGLDLGTEERLFSRLLGPRGLLRETTVVLVTHAVHRLSYSDHIISLDSTGHIIEQGSYEHLVQGTGYVSTLTSNLHGRKVSAHQVELEDPVCTEAKALVDATAVEVEVQTDTRASGDVQTWLYYFGALGNWRTVIYGILAVITGASMGFQNLVLTFWSNAIDAQGQEVNRMYLGLLGGVTAFSYISTLVLAWHFLVIMVPDSSELIHARLLTTVMRAPLSFFTNTDVGTIVNRFSQDLTVFDIELPYRFIDFSLSVFQTIMSAALMCVSASYFAATLPVVLGIVYALQKYYLRTSRQVRLLDLEAKSPLYSHFIESLSGLTTLRAFGWTSAFEERNMLLLDASQKPFYLLFCIQQWLALSLDVIVTVLGMVLMILIVQLRHHISGGFVGLALVNVMSFNQLLAQVVRNWTGVETSLGAVSRIKTFCTETQAEDLPKETEPAPPNWPSRGQISLRNVSAAYRTDDPHVINDIELVIEPGQRIGLCGRSGSGKSSILATIFRMLEVSDTSRLTIDGMDLSTMSRQGIRRSINAIPQDPFFLNGTVRFNADPRGEHDDTGILKALQRVQLTDIVAAKGGLDADLDADFFSHGQRQLFCLARAMLRKSTILVLDEATSSVDVKTDQLMQKIIREEFKDCTILAVAHRLDTILDFDKIVVLDAGRIVECDTPQNLLGRESAFKRLYES